MSLDPIEIPEGMDSLLVSLVRALEDAKNFEDAALCFVDCPKVKNGSLQLEIGTIDELMRLGEDVFNELILRDFLIDQDESGYASELDHLTLLEYRIALVGALARSLTSQLIAFSRMFSCPPDSLIEAAIATIREHADFRKTSFEERAECEFYKKEVEKKNEVQNESEHEINRPEDQGD